MDLFGDFRPLGFTIDHPSLNPLGDFPLGFGFLPTDQELIQHYLKKKLNKQPIEYDFIPYVNIYNHSPQELADLYPSCSGEDQKAVWYFFTPRDRKYKNGKRPNRAAGDGHWKATIADKPIYDNIINHIIIGFKKTLVFCQGQFDKSKKTDWIMHEYVVNQPSSGSVGQHVGMLLDDCVLCRIYKRTRGASNCQITDEEQEAVNCSEDDDDDPTHKRARYELEEEHPYNLLPVQKQDQILVPMQQQQNYPATNQENGISRLESWDAVDLEQLLNDFC